jgi:hypothetical protein
MGRAARHRRDVAAAVRGPHSGPRGPAVRELLKQFDARPRNAAKPTGGNGYLISRYDAGAAAKMSERQVKTAVRVANVPQEAFEAAVESEAPPSVTKLAEPPECERGRHPPPPSGRAPIMGADWPRPGRPLRRERLTHGVRTAVRRGAHRLSQSPARCAPPGLSCLAPYRKPIVGPRAVQRRAARRSRARTHPCRRRPGRQNRIPYRC